MDKLQKLIDANRVRECLRGTPFDVNLLDDDTLERCAVLMLHCCLNGPVGVNKVTTFPENYSGSIKGLLGINISNNSWARTCQPFATWLKASMPGPLISESQQVRLHGDLWPLNERSRASSSKSA